MSVAAVIISMVPGVKSGRQDPAGRLLADLQLGSTSRSPRIRPGPQRARRDWSATPPTRAAEGSCTLSPAADLSPHRQSCPLRELHASAANMTKVRTNL